MKKHFSLIAVSLCLALLAGCATATPSSTIPIMGTDYLKSAHYFADGWPINFWNCELDDLDNQLTQIAADGFNSIILVVPWREFQPDIQSQALADYPAQSLRTILEKAAEHHLGVLLRVGYTWDYASEESVLERYYNLLGDPSYQEAWISYVEDLYSLCSPYESFLGGFLCWEDFWNFTYTAQSLGEEKQGIEEAAFTGYQEYLKDNCSLEEVNALYGESFTDYSQIYFPASDSPALKLFYDFYDAFLNDLLRRSQQVFPNLSMEIRLDEDLYTNTEGGQSAYSHVSTFSCQDSNFTCSIFSLHMDSLNQGEKISAKEALTKTDTVLSDLKGTNGGKGIFVEQFLYYDNTPGTSNDAQIQEDQLNQYLEKVAPVLKKATMGYGVWAYKNYATDLLYNPQFARGLDGWETQGAVEAVEQNGSMQAQMTAGSLLRQVIPTARGIEDSTTTFYVRGECLADTPVELTVSFGSAEPVTWTFDPAQGPLWECSFPATGDYTLTIKAGGDLAIDNLKVYTRVQEGKLYDLDGNELSCIDSIRTLNHKLA